MEAYLEKGLWSWSHQQTLISRYLCSGYSLLVKPWLALGWTWDIATSDMAALQLPGKPQNLWPHGTTLQVSAPVTSDLWEVFLNYARAGHSTFRPQPFPTQKVLLSKFSPQLGWCAAYPLSPVLQCLFCICFMRTNKFKYPTLIDFSLGNFDLNRTVSLIA